MKHVPHARRQFLRRAATIAVAAGPLPALAARARALPPLGPTAMAVSAVPATVEAAADAALRGECRLAFHHTHTGERLDLVYAVDGRHLPGALDTLNIFLRDHYDGSVGRIEPTLLDQLHALALRLGGSSPFEVISAYRSPSTNEHLRSTRGGGVARKSLHQEGRAIDVRLPGVSLDALRNAALALGAGGVGYYPRERFVHVDTGRVRSW